MSGIEALYIFDEHNNLLLSHPYQLRPPPATVCIKAYTTHAPPRPSLLHLPNTSPPSILYALQADSLLLLSPTTTDVAPLLVLEFLHRLTDCLSDALGAPLLASRLEANYDLAARVFFEVCDAGLVAATEPNAVREAVDAPSALSKFLGLPSTAPSGAAAAAARGGVGTLGGSGMTGMGSGGATMRGDGGGSAGASAIPWRRSNVRHTSNELYVDLLETVEATFAPSGRAVAAFARGTVAFTCKVSGVPDLLLNLTAGPSGGGDRGERLRRVMQRPVFHPCVRLARWKQYGELSFVPPDGRFVLAGYEADLLDGMETLGGAAESVNLPVSVAVAAGLGPLRNEVEVKLSVSNRFGGSRPISPNPSFSSASTMRGSGATLPRAGPRSAAASLASFSSSTQDSKNPTVEDLKITVPLPSTARKIPDIRASRGEAHFSPTDGGMIWTVPSKALSQSSAAVLRFTVVGHEDEGFGGDSDGPLGSNGVKSTTYDYDEADVGGYQTTDPEQEGRSEETRLAADAASQSKRKAAAAALMPRSVNVSFAVKGWLASGLKVDALTIDTKRSRGLGEGVKPYKGVKYLTVSKGGIEVRC